VRIEELVNYFPYRYPTPEADSPFAVHAETLPCPWSPTHRLVKLGLKGRELTVTTRPAANLVFLLDVSGSMSDLNKLPLLKRALQLLVTQLREDDRVAIVVYAGASGLALPSTSGANKRRILDALNELGAGGSTNGAAGIHLDQDGQPFALITSGPGWALTASHEALEMLADPFGNRTIAGPSIKPGQGRVSYLVEVCDPSEATAFSYSVNDIVVSDFYTPSFFDPVTSQGVRYSFTGAIKKPRQVLKGGYLSWQEPVSGDWWQATFFGAKLTFRNLGPIDAAKGSLRSQIDAITTLETLKSVTMSQPVLTAAVDKIALGDDSSAARAKSLSGQIAALVKQARKG